jgi:FkbM family methyltransferase
MESLFHNLYNRRFYDDEFRIGSGDTVIDIGGYIGSFAITASRFAKQGRVFSFEPSPANFAQLEGNLRLNNVANARAFNHAVASSDRTITLFLDKMNPASNNIYMKRGHAVEIRALSLATIFREQQIDRCKFFKIACELHKPVYYGITDPAHTPQKLVEFLESKGFTVYRKPVNPYLGMMYAVNRNFGQPAPSGP